MGPDEGGCLPGLSIGVDEDSDASLNGLPSVPFEFKVQDIVAHFTTQHDLLSDLRFAPVDDNHYRIVCGDEAISSCLCDIPCRDVSLIHVFLN